MESPDLHSCWWCGGTKVWMDKTHLRWDMDYQVSCVDCCARGPGGEKAIDAAKKWNAGPARVAAKVRGG